MYVHEWEEGDLLIWDNTQTLHKGLGGYGDSQRLLYRAQTKITSYYQDQIKTLLNLSKINLYYLFLSYMREIKFFILKTFNKVIVSYKFYYIIKIS